MPSGIPFADSMADKHRPSDATVKRTVLCPREAHFVCISSWFSCVTFICGLGSLVIPFLHPSTIEAAPAPILVAEPSLRLRVGSETRDLGGASLSVIQTRTSMQNTAHAEARGLDQVTWSGEYSGWRDYVRRVQLAYERTERKKRKLLGAELASRLRGKAWEVAVEVDHGQLCKKSGPRYLLRFLEERLLKSPINDLGIRLEDMFVKLRRSPGTPMAQWASQVREQYRMLRRSLGKLRAKNLALTRDNVRQLDDAPSRRGAVEGNARRRSVEEPEPLRGESASLRHSATTLSPGDSPAGAAADGPRASPDGDPPEDEQRAGRDSRPDAHDADPGEHPQHHRLDDWDWDRRSWGHQSRWSHRDWQRWKAGKWSAQDGDDSSDESIIEWEEFLHDEDILPEEILGWILLRKAGLSPSARLAVQSAVQGDLSFDRVERTLRDQEEELLGLERKGSGKGKQAPRRSFWVEDEGHWGLVTCSLEDEFSEDQIAWWHEPGEVPEPDDETASCWTSSPAGHDVEWTMWNDEWMTQDSDGVWWTFADVKPWMDIEEVMLADPSLGQEMAEIYGQFEAKRRTFQESRKIMKDKLLGRGFFPSGGRKGGPRKGKGGRFSGSAAGKGGFSPVRSQASSVFGAKGFQKGGLKPGAVGQKGYSGCFICGQRDHDYRSCPKRSQGGTAALTEAVHAAFMVLEMDVQEAPPPDEGEVLHAATSAPENHNCVYATTSYSFQGKAVIDTGATETIGSIHAIHQLMELKGQNGETAKVKVYPQHTRRFKFGDGKVADALSYIEVPQTLNGKTVYLGMYVFDSQDVPILISIKTLRKLGALLDVARSMVVFQGVDAQLAIQLEVSPSGHLLLDLTKDWLTSSVNLAAETDTPQSAQYMPHVCVHSSHVPQYMRCAPVSYAFTAVTQERSTSQCSCSPADVQALRSTIRALERVRPLSSHGSAVHSFNSSFRADPQGARQREEQGEEGESGSSPEVRLLQNPAGGRTRPTCSGTTVHGCSQGNAHGARKSERKECLSGVDRLRNVSHTLVLHPVLRGHRALPTGGASAAGRDDHHDGAGRGREEAGNEGLLELQGCGPGGCRSILATSAQDHPSRERSPSKSCRTAGDLDRQEAGRGERQEGGQPRFGDIVERCSSPAGGSTFDGRDAGQEGCASEREVSRGPRVCGKPAEVSQVSKELAEPSSFSEEACMSAEHMLYQKADASAHRLLREKDFSYTSCERLLMSLFTSKHQNKQKVLRGAYDAFGLYGQGPFKGITDKAKAYPHFTRYLNAFLKYQADVQGIAFSTWTTVAVGLNAGSRMHRDLLNAKGTFNMITGMGSYSGGELWTELGPGEQCPRDELKIRVRPDQSRSRGRATSVLHACKVFDPKVWHATCKWTGQRLVIAAYTSSSISQLNSEQRGDLRQLGFPLPRMTPQSQISLCSPEEMTFWAQNKKLTSEQKKFLHQELSSHAEEVSATVDSLPQVENPTGRPSLSILEVGGHDSNISIVSQQRGVQHTFLANLGFDVTRAKDHDQIVSWVMEHRPSWIWMSPPFEENHVENKPETKQESQARKRRKHALDLCVRLALLQHLEGRDFVIEIPKASNTWRRSRYKQFASELRDAQSLHECFVDGCCFKELHDAEGRSSNVAWRLATSSQSMSQMLQCRCCGQHEHSLEHGDLKRCPGRIPMGTARCAVNEMITSDEIRAKENASAEMMYEWNLGLDEVNESLKDPDKMDKSDRLLHAQVMRLHRRCGHPSNRALCNTLKAKGVDERTMKIAQHLVCDECVQMKMQQSHLPVSLYRSEILWETLQMDHLDLKFGDEIIHILLLVEEASGYCVAVEMHRRHKDTCRNATTDEVLSAVEREWIMKFGYPRKIRLDPEGAFRGRDLEEWAASANVEIEPIPAEDHGQIGIVERMVGVLKQNTLTLLQNTVMDPFRAFVLSTAAHNENEFVSGFTPLQWVFGRQISAGRRQFSEDENIPLHCSEGTSGTNFQENLQARVRAETIFRKSQAARRISQAMNSKTRKNAVFLPGDLVYYRRVKPPADYPAHDQIRPKQHQSRWFGPGRVLATETRSEAQGLERRPAHVIWIVSHGRLKRCAGWQLRHASQTEKIISEGTEAPVMSWSFHQLVQHLQKGQYDIYDDLVLPEDLMNPGSSIPTPGTRLRARSAGERDGDPRGRSMSRTRALSRGRSLGSGNHGSRDVRSRSPLQGHGNRSGMKQEQLSEEQVGEMSLQQLLDTKEPIHEVFSKPASTASSSKRSSGPLFQNPQFKRQKERREKEDEERVNLVWLDEDEEECAFHLQENELAACELSVEMPESEQDWRKFTKNASAWIAQALRKSEVRWTTLSNDQKADFNKAKEAEVDQWLQAEAAAAIEGHIPRERVMQMRWVLSYKESGAAKARIVILGFQDPDLDKLVSSSPTMSRRTRQLVLQYAAQRGWQTMKGDIKAAFLQGPASQVERKIYAMPVPELARALGIPEGRAVQVRKAAYGLVNAPAEFYRAVDNTLKSLGFEPLLCDPCCWRLREWNETKQCYETIGIISSHVDDFLVMGSDSNSTWVEALKSFHAHFRWSPWEHTSYTHCGVVIKELRDGSKVLDHSKYCEGLQQIPVDKDRKESDAATPQEVGQLRALLGAAQWRAYNTGPQHQAKVGLLLSQVGKATVATLREANKLCREIHGMRNLSVRINYLPGVAPCDVQFICWADASLANRADLSSTGGYVIAATSPDMASGETAPLSLISWRSSKLSRIARSSLAAEIQAFSEGEEELMFVRLCWSELCGNTVDIQRPEEAYSKVPGIMVTDAKSLYDVIRKGDLNGAGLGLRDKYGALEVLSVLQRLRSGATTTRWVNSDAQLADSLTKHKVSSALHRAMHQHAWTLVFDPHFVSAKRSKMT